MNFKLHLPHEKYKNSFLAALAEMQTPSDCRAWNYLGDNAPLEISDFTQYVQTLIDRETTPPPGFVRDSVYWAIQDSQVIGRIAIRHELNDFLKKIGGHIGYIVRPGWRGKGVATEMVKQILLTPKAREIGKLLLTCNDGNIASEKSILKNGGVFESTIEVAPGKPLKKRFWIEI